MALGQENLTSPLSSVLQWLLPTKEVIRGDCFAYLSLLHVSDHSGYYRQQEVTWGDCLAYLSLSLSHVSDLVVAIADNMKSSGENTLLSLSASCV